jgi:hypothetical protein
MADRIIRFPLPQWGNAEPRWVALASMGVQWRASMWRLGCVALSDADIDALDQAAPSCAGIKRCSIRSACMVFSASTISIDQFEKSWGRRPGWPLPQARRQAHPSPQGTCGMRVASVDTPSLLELRAIVAQRLHACGAFDRCIAEDRRTILAQACLVIVYLTTREEGRTIYLTHLCPPVDRTRSQTVLDTRARLCPDAIAAVRECVATWRAHFWQDGWHPAPWGGCCDGMRETLLEGFVTDTRQQALATKALRLMAAFAECPACVAILLFCGYWRQPTWARALSTASSGTRGNGAERDSASPPRRYWGRALILSGLGGTACVVASTLPCDPGTVQRT